MTNEDYIGKKLSECPDGTVAVVVLSAGEQKEVVVRALRLGRVQGVLTKDMGPEGYTQSARPDEYTVLHIIKLGRPRPTTLADCPAGEAWADGRGTIWWRDTTSDVCVINSMHDFPQATRDPNTTRPVRGRDEDIGPDWIRLGQITGILIDGKPWPAKDGDE